MSFWRFAIFILFALAILLGANWLIYFSIVRLWPLTSSLSKIFLASLLLALVVGFVLISALAHWQGSPLVKYVYFGWSFLMGIWTYVFIAMVATGFVFIIFKFTDININPRPFLVAGLVLAVGFSIYGYWNAQRVRVVNTSVRLQNIPVEWKGKTVVQISDMHLGHVQGKDFLQKIVQQVNSLHPYAVFITGDLFDGMDGDLGFAAEGLNAIHSEAGTYFVTGNHEVYLGMDIARAVLAQTRVVVLNDKVVHVRGMQIVGLDFVEEGVSRDVGAIIPSLDGFMAGMPTIFLYHTPTNIAQAQAAGVNLQLSGHTHAGQLFPFRIFTHLIYKKYDYGLHVQGSYAIYTSSGAGTWGPPMRTGNHPEIVAIRLE